MKERRKGKKRKRKKEKSQEQIMEKIGNASQRKTNQVSFIPFTNKQKEYSYGTTNITSVELTKSKTE